MANMGYTRPRLGESLTEKNMNDMLIKLYVKFQELASREEGQDLVEYALVVALIAFAAVAGMRSLASGISTAFTNIASALSTNIT